jgi:hypothetical protein
MDINDTSSSEYSWESILECICLWASDPAAAGSAVTDTGKIPLRRLLPLECSYSCSGVNLYDLLTHLFTLKLNHRISTPTGKYYDPLHGKLANHKTSPYVGQHNIEEIRTYIHIPSGIQTHDPSVWAVIDKNYFKFRGHCDHAKYMV